MASTRSALLRDMFGHRPNEADYIDDLETFKSAVVTSLADGDNRKTRLGNDQYGQKKLLKGLAADPKATMTAFDNITKGLSADAAASLAADIQAFRGDLADINKDWTPTSPIGGTGITAYDLEPQVKVLWPLRTPLRNTVPREHGQGNARRFKRLDSVTNSGQASPAISPFFSSQTQTSTWGPTNNITLARPKKIAYTGTDAVASYVELGFSDSVDWITQFEAIGFDDVRALSHTAGLFAHLMGEERAILFGRGATTGGYHGTVAAPTTAVAGSGSGGSLATNTYFFYVTANTGFGESLPSTVQNSGALTGPSASATVTVTPPAAGSIGVWNLYVGTTTGIANAKFQTTFTGNSYILTTFNAAGAVAANVDTSFDANGYDGYLTVQSDPALTGYYVNQNAKFSTTNPGSELDLALQTMWNANGADPDEIWMSGANRVEFGQLMRIGGTNGAASGYRTNVTTGDGKVIMGTSVAGYVNQLTSKVTDLATHPFMPQGCCLIRSTSLPIENSNITAPVSAVNVQEYMAVNWADIQMTYDISTYQIGTILHRAPIFSGMISGIL
jgi:hypothetical protein